MPVYYDPDTGNPVEPTRDKNGTSSKEQPASTLKVGLFPSPPTDVPAPKQYSDAELTKSFRDTWATMPPSMVGLINPNDISVHYDNAGDEPSDVIAYVKEGDRRNIYVRQPDKVLANPRQMWGHEGTHLIQNGLPADMASQIGKDPDNSDAYNYGGDKGLSDWRGQKKTLLQLGREQQAATIQHYLAQEDGYNKLKAADPSTYTPTDIEKIKAWEAAKQIYQMYVDDFKTWKASPQTSVAESADSSAVFHANYVVNFGDPAPGDHSRERHPSADGTLPTQGTPQYYNPDTGQPINSNPQIPPEASEDAFKAGVHSKMLNVTPGFAYQNKDEIDKQVRAVSPNYDNGEIDPTILNDLKIGLEGSIFGLHHREKLPDQVKNPGMMDKFVSGLSQMVADAPFMLAGGVAGGAAGSEVPVVGNVVGAGAGAFAVPSAVREALILGIKNGDVKGFGDLLHRAADVTWAATKGAATGAVTALTEGIPVAGFIAKSPLGSMAVKGLYQATAMTTAADLLEGKLPNKDDFAGNAALIVPLNLITHGMAMKSGETKEALMDVYAKDGKTPAESADTLAAQPPVKPDLPEGLRPAINLGESTVDGDTTENHEELATRTLRTKPVSMDELEAEPDKADKVLENPQIHEQPVIDRAWQIKKDAVDRGEVYDKSEDRDGIKTEELPPSIRSIAEEYGRDRGSKGSGETEDSNPYIDARWSKQTLNVEKAWSAAQLRPGMSSTVRGISRSEGPIVVDDRGIVLDGNHRLFEARNRGDESIEAYVLSPKPKVLNIDDLYNHASMKSGRGFVTPDGKFLSRMEAKQWMKTNEPDVHEMWTSVAGDKQAEFHSEDYAEARNRVQARSVAEGDPTIANVSQQNAQRLAAAREGLNKIKAGDSSKGYGREVLRTLFVGQRDTRIAATTQLRDSIAKIIPDFHDQEALSILRDYKGTPDKLAADLEQIQNGDSERMKELIPSIERAMNPSPELLEADKRLTGYYTNALDEGRQLGFMESRIDPSHYSPHILTRILEGEKPTQGVSRPAMARSTPFAQERSYPTILDALKTGKLDARTVNALDALSVYGDRHATVVATKILATELSNTELGKYGTQDKHPDGWVQMAPNQSAFRNNIAVTDAATGEAHVLSQSLYVPKDVADAMRPIIEADVLSHQPGVKGFKSVQAFTKSIELGLSIFHMKALSITAMNNMSFADFTKSLASDTKSPEFAAEEREWAADGLQTTKTTTPYEAYQGLKESSIKESFDVRSLPGIKQLDEIAKSLTHETFDVIQRKFKVMDASLKGASWRGKNPEASDEEYFAARRSIAKEVNAAYGGLNWEVMGWGKNARELTRMVMLAPDWTFSNVANLKYAGEGGSAGSAARMFWVKSFSTGIALTQATSLAVSGQLSDHPTQVYLGKDKDGKKLYSNWYFAGAPKDSITLLDRVQRDGALSGLAEFLTAKLGPIAATGIGLATNKSGTGKPIYKKSDSQGEKDVKQSEFVAGRAVPFTVANVAEMLMDGKEHSMMEYVGSLAGTYTIHESAKSGAKESVLPGEKKSSRGIKLPGQSRSKKFSIRSGR